MPGRNYRIIFIAIQARDTQHADKIQHINVTLHHSLAQYFIAWMGCGWLWRVLWIPQSHQQAADLLCVPTQVSSAHGESRLQKAGGRDGTCHVHPFRHWVVQVMDHALYSVMYSASESCTQPLILLTKNCLCCLKLSKNFRHWMESADNWYNHIFSYKVFI